MTTWLRIVYKKALGEKVLTKPMERGSLESPTLNTHESVTKRQKTPGILSKVTHGIKLIFNRLFKRKA